MARVKCKYCGETFDRATQPYVAIPTGQTHRYAHSACYLRERVSNPKLPMYEIIDPTAIVKCIYCKKDINKNTMSYRLITPGKYAHASCVEKEEKREKFLEFSKNENSSQYKLLKIINRPNKIILNFHILSFLSLQ